jgi:hypothetical protein
MNENKQLYVHGVEVTQALQYYRADLHLFDAHDRGPDNSLWLTAQKPAWVRVYVRSGAAGSVHGVTGKLSVTGYGSGAAITELSPEAPGMVDAFPEATGQPFVAADALYKLERNDITATLNFVIPARQMCGKLQLLAKIWTEDGLSDEKVLFVEATQRQRLWLRGVLIGYEGPDPAERVEPPAMADLQATSAWTLLVYPTAPAVYSKAGTFMLSQPLGTNGCAGGDPGWIELNTKLVKAADADGNVPGAIYYGLVAQGVAGGGGCGGPAASGLFGYAAGYSITPNLAAHHGAEQVMAHEIGHALRGVAHTQGCVPPADSAPNDPDYPAYEPYDWAGAPQASIGEYGLNINTGEILTPADYSDLMSYCPKNRLWMSLYGHKKATLHPWLHPEPVCPPTLSTKVPRYHDPKLRIPDPTAGWIVDALQPTIAIVGVLDASGAFALSYVRRTRSFGRSQGASTAYVAVLEDADGQELARAPLLRITSAAMSGGPCGCAGTEGEPPYLLKAMLPDVAPGAVLRIMEDGEEIWTKRAPEEPPRVLDLAAAIDRRRQVTLQWQLESAQPEEIEFWLQWSADEGQSWQSLATDIRTTEATCSLEGLPAGKIQLRVIAHDDFNSVASEAVEVTAPAQPSVITILHPREGAVLATGRTLRLWAVATSPDEEIETYDLVWLVDGHEAGRGLEVWTVAPAEGEHTCTLRLEGQGERRQQTVFFRTAAPPCPPARAWST